MAKILNFMYDVEVEGLGPVGGFSSVKGLKEADDISEYREGDDPETADKYPGLTKYDNVTLERGMDTSTSGNFFRTWRAQVKDAKRVANTDDGTMGATGGSDESYKHKVKIYLKDKAGNRVKCFVLRKAFPPEQEFDDMEGLGGDVYKERLVLAHSGLAVYDSGIAGG